MKVAYVCADRGIPVFGRKGCSVHVQAILRAFLRRGDEVDLYAARLGGSVPADLQAVNVHHVVPEADTWSQTGLRRSPLAVDRALHAVLEDRGIAYDLLYERHALWSSRAMEWAEGRGIDRVLEINAPLVEEQLEHRQLENPAFARTVVFAALRAAQLRVAVSDEVALQHRQHGLVLEDFLICPNGIDPDRFPSPHESAASPRPERPFTIGFLGTLKPWHGLEVLLDAFSRVAHSDPTCRLLVVGDGPLRESIASRLMREGLAHRATLTGSVETSQVSYWLAKMDVGTAPYAKAEGLYFSPLKVVEYMAAGLPVIASRAGQIESLIQHETSGLLVKAGDAMELADAIERLRREPALARDMGRSARAQVFAHCTWDAVLERILSSLPRVRLASATSHLAERDWVTQEQGHG